MSCLHSAISLSLRNEEVFQELNPDGTVSSAFYEYLRLLDLGVDSIFTDFADTRRAAVDALTADPAGHGGAGPHGYSMSSLLGCARSPNTEADTRGTDIGRAHPALPVRRR
jgi:hypothetical protein